MGIFKSKMCAELAIPIDGTIKTYKLKGVPITDHKIYKYEFELKCDGIQAQIIANNIDNGTISYQFENQKTCRVIEKTIINNMVKKYNGINKWNTVTSMEYLIFPNYIQDLPKRTSNILFFYTR